MQKVVFWQDIGSPLKLVKKAPNNKRGPKANILDKMGSSGLLMKANQLKILERYYHI